MHPIMLVRLTLTPIIERIHQIVIKQFPFLMNTWKWKLNRTNSLVDWACLDSHIFSLSHQCIYISFSLSLRFPVNSVLCSFSASSLFVLSNREHHTRYSLLSFSFFFLHFDDIMIYLFFKMANIRFPSFFSIYFSFSCKKYPTNSREK